MPELKGICFEILGLVMSFRKPRYENYQLSYSIPPKTMVAGMIANAYGHGEKFFYELLKDFQYGVVTLGIRGKFKDLWRAIQGKGVKGGERAVFQREKLFYPHYRIYATSKTFLGNIQEALRAPQNPIYLGLSEELIEIKDSQELSLKTESTDLVDTMIPLNWMSKIADMEWRKSLEGLKSFLPPQVESMVVDYRVNFKGMVRSKREPEKSTEVLVISGGRFRLKEKIEVYKGIENDHILLF